MDKKKIFLVSLGHLSCDINGGALPAILPFLITAYGFDYQAAAGLMFAFSCLSSIIQPAFGYLSDKLSKPWFIPVGVLLAGGGLASIGFLHSYWAIFAAIALSGVGAALFHPEGARFANKVSGASKGTGLSLFSIGGNSGFVFGPMLAVAAIGAFGMPGTSVFGLIALVMSVILLYQISHLSGMKKTETEGAKAAGETEEVKNNWKEFSKLTLAIISRSVLFVGCNTFIPLYWIHNFGQSKAAGAAALTCFCTFGVISNFIGGMLSDRFGYLRIIRLSYVVLIPSIVLFGLVDNLYAAFALLLPLGFSLYAPFSSMVVLGQKYLAKNIGFASGRKGHHKKGMRIVEQDTSLALLPEDRSLVAQLVRYHRKAWPAMRHRRFAALGKKDREALNKAAALIRMADALDYRHMEAVRDVAIDLQPGKVVLTLSGAQDCAPEQDRLLVKGDLFMHIFGVELECVCPIL